MMLSSLCFALINICVKILASGDQYFEGIQNYPVHELVFFRSVISLTICIAIIKYKKIPFFGVNKKWLIIRGIMGVTSLTMFFFTVKHLPIAIATTVQYLSPIFTVIFAINWQKEKVKSVQWLFFLISLIGVAVIRFSDDGNISFDPKWLMLGLLSAILSGVAYNAIMKCRNTDAPITVVMYFPLIATPIMFLGCIFYGYVIPNGIEWVLLLIIGSLTQVAQISMTRAFHADNAARVTPIKYIGAIYAVAVGYFIFDEEIGMYSSFGILLIISGVLLNTFLKGLKQNSLKKS